MKQRLLFVDDEPKVLMGLRRSLRCHREQWDMEFAEGARAALDCCARQPFDMVVSDARMPGMDGAELLREVLSRYPDTVRIVLSGQCSDEAVLKCVGVAHQFLNKPCDPDTLKSVVQRIATIRNVFHNSTLRGAISSTQWLPSQPGVCRALTECMARVDASIEDVAAIIATDISTTTRVVCLVSSGFFGSPQRVSSASQAVRLLGLERMRALLGAPAAFQSPVGDTHADSIVDCNRRGQAMARAAASIARTLSDDLGLRGSAELAGMLHPMSDLALLGKPLASEIRPSGGDIRRPEVAGGTPTGPSQLHLSGYLAALWGVPDAVVQALTYVETPRACSSEERGPLVALHIAVAMTSEAVELDAAFLERLGIADAACEWRDICDRCREEALQP